MGEIKGWCPGALRPMMTGDGLLVRLRLAGGQMSFDQARAVAALSRRYGNGKISLSARANLQLRGVSPEDHPRLIAELQALGLVGDNDRAEAVRNIIVNPLDGLTELAPLAAALDARLARGEALWALPGKFGFALDGGGPAGLGEISADVRFEAVETPQGLRFGLMLDGVDHLYFGLWNRADVPDVAAAAARMFIEARQANPALRRMRDHTLRQINSPARQEAEGGQFASLMPELAQHQHWCIVPRQPRPAPELHEILGQHRGFFGLAAPFGLMDAEALAALASACQHAGADELRLTPWRALLAMSVKPLRLADLSQDGGLWITDPSDPRLYIAACPGAPLCSSGETQALDDARALAPQFAGADGLMLHVSGCSKGCAHPGRAPLTLVGRHGLYDLILRGDTRAKPAHTALMPEQLPRIISELMRNFNVDA